MAIPNFDQMGLLPAGVWDCTLGEAELRFCWNAHRQQLWSRLRHFLNVEVAPLNLPDPVWVDGSFVRAKELPSDIDVVLDTTNAPLSSVAAVLMLRVRHDQIKQQYGVDVWQKHPAIPNDLTSFFQYAGDKCAAELNIQPKDPKGILRIQP